MMTISPVRSAGQSTRRTQARNTSVSVAPEGGHAGGGAIQADGSNHGRGVPVAVRGAGHHPRAARRATPQAGHVGLRPLFIKEDEPRGVEAALPPAPLPAGLRDVGTLLFAGMERLFLYVSPSAASA